MEINGPDEWRIDSQRYECASACLRFLSLFILCDFTLHTWVWYIPLYLYNATNVYIVLSFRKIPAKEIECIGDIFLHQLEKISIDGADSAKFFIP